jgi:hypothetical protein
LVDKVIQRPLIDIVQHDLVGIVKNILYLALQGEEEQNVEIKLKKFGIHEEKGPVCFNC